MHVYLGMLAFGGDIRTSLVVFVKGTMPLVCTHCTKFSGLIKNVYKMVSHTNYPANCNFGKLSWQSW